jgi:hypothetical protein
MTDMRHKTTQTLWTYFNLVREEEEVPLRSAIDPVALKTVLPDLFILELAQHGDLRFRLAGTRLCAMMGRELRGLSFSGIFSSSRRHKMGLAGQTVLTTRQPALANVWLRVNDDEREEIELMMLPLASAPGQVDRIFGSVARFTPGEPPMLQNPLFDVQAIRFLHPGEDGLATPEGRPAEARIFAASPERMRRFTVIEGGRRF